MLNDFALQIRQGYGMTELSPVSHIIPHKNVKYVSSAKHFHYQYGYKYVA